MEDVPYIEIAEQIGVGNRFADDNIRELNKDNTPMTIPKSRLVKQLSRYVEENMACSACYGSLIHALDRLKDMGALYRLEKRYILDKDIRIGLWRE